MSKQKYSVWLTRVKKDNLEIVVEADSEEDAAEKAEALGNLYLYSDEEWTADIAYIDSYNISIEEADDE